MKTILFKTAPLILLLNVQSVFAFKINEPSLKCQQLSKNEQVCKGLKNKQQHESETGSNDYTGYIDVTLNVKLATCEKDFVDQCVKNVEKIEKNINLQFGETYPTNVGAIDITPEVTPYGAVDITSLVDFEKTLCSEIKKQKQISFWFWDKSKFYNACTKLFN